MSRSRLVKSRIWRAHVEGAKADPAGVKEYCRRNSISLQSLSGWRKRFQLEDSASGISEGVSSFLPIVVSKQTLSLTANVGAGIPDPKWAAEFVRHLFMRHAGIES